MRIGELAGRSGVSTKALRFYEQVGLLAPPDRRPSGYRDYDESALARLRFVRGAQAAGLTLAEIRQVIEVRDQTGPPCQHVTQLLEAHADDLDRRIDELIALREEVRRLRASAAGLDPAFCDAVTICHVITDPGSAPPFAANGGKRP